MIKAVKFFMLLSVVWSLTACNTISDHYKKFKERENEYQHSRATDDLVVPPGLEDKQIREDYEIPAIRSQQAARQVSLLPPNSIAEQVAQGKITEETLKQRSKQLSTTVAPIKQEASTLTFNQNLDAVWDQIGKALNIAEYKIVEQDKQIATYFILDTEITGNKITRDTPIYQVHMQEEGETNVKVSLTDNDGKELDALTTSRVLNNIHNALMGKTENSMMKWLKKHI